MSKPGVDPTSGISSGDVLILPERHPACRRRETQLGFRMERENLAGDGKLDAVLRKPAVAVLTFANLSGDNAVSLSPQARVSSSSARKDNR